MTILTDYVKTVIIRKDGFFPSKPWCADLIMNDGQIMKSWQYNFKTKKHLIDTVKYILPGVVISTN
jgi:hypothetical protein